jgi:hypothetical protein
MLHQQMSIVDGEQHGPTLLYLLADVLTEPGQVTESDGRSLQFMTQ